jgi:hypothetical protein
VGVERVQRRGEERGREERGGIGWRKGKGFED